MNNLGQIFYGLHMVEGVAEYIGSEGPYRILLSESTIKKMDASFIGRPVFVEHVDEVNHRTLKADADGYVIKSFFNKADGRHWAQFMVTTDEAKNRIKQGWKLSNAYHPKMYTNGGTWHGVQYEKEVVGAEYEHLAIVNNPRYAESIVLTPEEFKLYNEKKELELERLANSLGQVENKPEPTVVPVKAKGATRKMAFNIFKKEKVENSIISDLENHGIELPKSRKEVTLAQIVNAADEMEMRNGFANGSDKIKMNGEDDMTVNELKEKYEQSKKKNNELMEAQAQFETRKNEDEEEEKKKNKKKNEAEASPEGHFNKLVNAHEIPVAHTAPDVVQPNRVALGKSKYGSGK